MWVTDQAPSDLFAEGDAGERKLGTAPPPGGTRFAVLDFLPGNSLHGQHRSDTIDYVICTKGAIDMLLDDQVVHMEAGDIMIQRGTNHAWSNRGTEPASDRRRPGGRRAQAGGIDPGQRERAMNGQEKLRVNRHRNGTPLGCRSTG